jgi:hypothetical protein
LLVDLERQLDLHEVVEQRDVHEAATVVVVLDEELLVSVVEMAH